MLLYKMLRNISDIRSAITTFGCSLNKSSNNYLASNKMAFDLCSFYMAQFGEKIKLLSDDTISDLRKYIDLSIFRYFRNIISHDYDSVNKDLLCVYISQVISNSSFYAISNRREYCIKNRRS